MLPSRLLPLPVGLPPPREVDGLGVSPAGEVLIKVGRVVIRGLSMGGEYSTYYREEEIRFFGGWNPPTQLANLAKKNN